jgi:hypothetical protein
MTIFTSLQLSVSTADEERYYFFSRDSIPIGLEEAEALFPPGMYRVVDGRVFRIVSSREQSPTTAEEERVRKKQF